MPANRRITELPLTTSGVVVDTDILPIVVGVAGGVGITSRISVTELRLKLGTQPPGDGRTVTNSATYLDNNKLFNIKDYGALGTGAVNDAAAIAAAYAATPEGGTMLIPIGKFRFDTQLVFNRKVNIVGLGSGSALVPNLASAVTDGIVVNSTLALIGFLRYDNFAILSNAVNACRDAIVFNRMNQSEVNIFVNASSARYGTRIVACIISRFKIVSSTNYPYPAGYGTGMSAADSIRVQYDGTYGGCNNNVFDVKIEGGNNGLWIEQQNNQGNNVITGVIEGTSSGTRGLYALGCIGLDITNLHCEGNNGAVELDSCAASSIGGGSQFLATGNAGKIILTASSRIWLGSLYCDSIDIGTTCSDIMLSSACKNGASGGVITDTARKATRATGVFSGTVAAANGIATTLFDLSTKGYGFYMVGASIQNVGAAYHSFGVYHWDGTVGSKIFGTDGALLLQTFATPNVKGTQNSGGAQNITYTVQYLPYGT